MTEKQPGRPTLGEDCKRITVLTDTKVVNKLTEVAKEDGRSRSGLIRHLFRKFLKDRW